MQKIYTIIIGFLVMLSTQMSAQCPTVYDFYGASTSTPYWYSCAPGAYTLNVQSPNNWGAYTINWGDGSAVSSGATWNSPTAVAHTYAAAVDSFVVVITQVSTGCTIQGVLVMEESTSASIQIPVGGLTQACAPQIMDFINSSTKVSETTTFTWDFGDGSPQETYDYTNWHQTISHVYQQGTVDCETQVTLVASNYCNTIQGGPSTATYNPIRIWDIDDAAISASATILCYPDTTVTLTNTTERNCLFQGNIYQRYEYWNFGDYWGLGHDSIIDWTPWPPTFPHTLHYPGIGTYTAQLLDSNYCGIDPASITIQIVAPPEAALSASVTSVCAGTSVTFNQLSTGGTNYAWNFGDGSGWVNSGSGNTTHTFSTPGTYTVTTQVSVNSSGGGCSDQASVQITVLPSPSVSITADNTSGCGTLDVNYTSVSANATSWNWIFDVAPNTYSGQTPPTIHYTTTGTHNTTLQVTGANGCVASAATTVRVWSIPTANFTVSNLCLGQTAHFNNTSTNGSGSGGSINSYHWDFGDGGSSTSQNPNHTYNTAGAFTVELIVNTAHCSDTLTQSISVDPAPVPSFTRTPTSGCSPLDVVFTNTTANAATYLWNFGDGATSTLENPTHTFVNTTSSNQTFTITLTAYNAFGCGASTTKTVTVNPGAVANFTGTNYPPSCTALAASFTNTSQNATSYQWNFGDGATSTQTSPTHTYTNNTGVIQVLPVTLIAISPTGCNDTITQNITVFPIANFNVNITGGSGCSPYSLTMPYVAGVQAYSWDFGDGTTSTQPMPAHTYTNNTTAPVTYTITFIGTSAFGCVDTATTTVTVNPSPVAQFSTDVTSGCGPLTVTFNNASINASTYSWNFGDGVTSTSSAASFTHVFSNNTTSIQTYNVTLDVTSAQGCISHYAASIQVYPGVVADFVDPGAFCSPATVGFSNMSTNANSYAWVLGNGLQSIANNPSSYYVNNGGVDSVFHVQLTATSSYGCTATITKDLIIHPTAVSSFTLSDASACAPAPVVITNNSVNATSYTWTYGDGTSDTDANATHVHTFLTPTAAQQDYTITLVATNSYGCSNTSSGQFTLFPQINVDFTTSGSGCSPVQAYFVNQSTGASQFTWNFGDGTASSAAFPNHVYTNNTSATVNYDVELIGVSSFGCQDTATAQVEVFAQPLAQFNTDVFSGCSPLDVTLTNTSINCSIYSWSYGDGSVSLDASPSHHHVFVNTGSTPQSFTIELIGRNPEGCISVSSSTVTVNPSVTANFNDPGAQCTPAAISFGAANAVSSSYAWDFGNGQQSSQQNANVVFTNNSATDTTYHVLLVVTTAYGCADSMAHDVTIHPSAYAAFDLSDATACSPAPVTITNNSVNATSYSWSYGDGDTSSEAAAQHTHVFQSPSSSQTNYTVELTATNAYGCASTASAQFTVYPQIHVDFTSSGSGCAPVQSFFVNQSTGASSFVWNFGDGTSSTQSFPGHIFNNTTSATIDYDVTLIGTSNFGCTDTASAVITVNPQPTAFIAIDALSGCSPLSVTIENNSVNCATYAWSYGDGSVSTETATSHTHVFTNLGSQPQNFTIQLVGTSADGCVTQTSTSVLVYPQVTANFTDPGAHCSPYSANLVSSSVNAQTYSWDLGNGMQSIEQNPTMDYTNFSSVDTTFNISLAVASIYGCTDSIAHALVVHPTPTAVFSLSQPTACSPAPIVITNNSTNADSYTWSYGDGSSDNIADSTHVHVFQTPLSVQVNYTITLTASTDAGCVSTTTAPFTLYPLITTDFSVNASGCTPVQAFFANQSTGASSYAWNFGDGSTSTLPLPNHVFDNETAAPVDYTITMIGTSSFGCSDTSSTTITVNPKPHALFTLDATNGCGPVEAALTNMSTNAVSYSWVYGDATSSTVADSVHTHLFVNPSNQPQTFNVTLVAIGMDGCTSQYTNGLQVYPHVTADFANLGEFCTPATVYVDNNSTNANSYAWNFGNGLMSNDANPTVLFQNNTLADITYNVTLVATSNFGCTDTLTKPVVIHPKPMADFSLSASAACTPAPVTITNNSTLGTSFYWNYGDGTNDTNADAQHSHTFQTPVNGQSYYTINLIAITDAGCADTTSAQFNLYPQVIAAFTGNAAGCSPYQSFFVNQSVGAVTYAWSFSDGTLSSETNPSHIFTTGNTTDQTFIAQLVATNQFGCSDTTQSNIEVYHTPLAVALLDSLTSCYPQVATLANASIGADSFQWAYGTGETNSTSDVTHTHTFYNLGSDLTTYHVSLVASTDHGCTSTDMVDVEVAPALNTTFAVNAHGCTPVVAYFDNTSDNAVSYHWDFGDGDSSNEFEPSHTFFNWGIGDTTYTVTLTSYNLYGCTETFQSEVVVYSAPVADFTVAPSTQTWPSATVALDNTTSGGTLSYSWYMGDATELYVAEPGSYTYSTWGEYTIRLIASNGACSDTAFQSITILPPPPVAAFTGPAEGCAPLVVQFQNLSQYAQSSDWQFGDGGVANATNPVYTFWTPGTYTVTLTVHGYDGSTDVMVQEQIIHVYPTAVASFICTPNQVSIPSQPVYCMNHSQNASIYHWEFGDGNTSSEESPVYYYTEEGVYDVTLIADNQYHCPDTITVVSAVYADNNGMIDFPNAFTPATTGGNGGAYDPMGYNNDVFFPLHAGVTDYNLQIFNKWGELLFESKDVHHGWDGYYNGLMCPEDVYAWKVRARLVNGQLLEKAGDVTLLVK